MPEEHQYRTAQDSPSPTLRELAMVLFRQRTAFLSVCGLVFTLAFVYAFAGVSYRSEMRVLVRRGRADPPVTAQQNAPPDFSRVEVTEEELNSEVELLKDDDVLRRVVEENDLASHDWLGWLRPNETAGARVQRAVKRLAGQLKVEPLKKTNLIAVSYEAADPQLAAKTLQSLSAIYLEKHMRVHRPAGQIHFFDLQTAESKRQLDDSAGKLIAFSNAHRVCRGHSATRSDAASHGRRRGSLSRRPGRNVRGGTSCAEIESSVSGAARAEALRRLRRPIIRSCCAL